MALVNHTNYRVSAICIFFLFAACINFSYAADPVEEIDEQALADRLDLKSGHVTIDTVVTKTDKAKASKTVKARRREVWFDIDKFRGDSIFNRGSPNEYRTITCFAFGERMHWNSQVLGKNAQYVATFGDNSSGQKSPIEDIPDPRLLGIVPAPTYLMLNMGLRSTVGSTHRKDVTVVDIVHDGRKCRSVSYKRESDGASVLYIVCPEMAGRVIFVKLDFDDGETHTVWTSVSEYKQESGLWSKLPSRCVYEGIENGVVNAREECVITLDKINEKPDDELFRISGMSIPVGTKTQHLGKDNKGLMVWNGKEEIPERRAKQLERRSSMHIVDNSRRYAMYIAMAFSLTVLSSLLYYKHRRRRSVSNV